MISRKEDYALRVMVELSAKNSGSITTKELAEAVEAPYAFIAKIVAELAARGLIEVSRGRNGGVKLAANPKKTTALTVLEAISGPPQLNRCINDPGACPRSGFCSIHEALEKAQQQLVKALGVDLARLARNQEIKMAAIT